MQEARPIISSIIVDPRWRDCVQRLVISAGILNEDVERTVFNSFCAIPRDGFAEGSPSSLAFKDVELPLVNGQWLTRPSVLIRMMGLINIRKRMRILELGFGSGYLCAVMATAGAQVFGVEVLSSFAQSSRKQLDNLGHHGVVVRRGEGRRGWGEVGPFDAIVASYPVSDEGELPLDQLALQGVLVAPLVSAGATRLTIWKRSDDGIRRVTFEAIDFR